jgi:RNA polymerase sigma factor (sigma-70 family)
MQRLLIDRWRRRRNHGERVPLDAARFVPAPARELSDLGSLMERLRTVAPRHAAAVRLKFFAGMTEPEIARAMGTSPRTVRRLLSEAKCRLRRQMTIRISSTK